MNSYKIEYRDNKTLKITAGGDSYVFFRVSYGLLQNKLHGINLRSEHKSNFIVYLLFGKSSIGEDTLYVGTSTKGIDDRPVEHEDKGIPWEQCIIFTAEDKDLNESIILHIEDRIRKMIDMSSKRYRNETHRTKEHSANSEQQELAERKFIPAILDVYDILGINIRPKQSIDMRPFIKNVPEGPVKYISRMDYRELNITDDMNDWLNIAESIGIELDKESKPSVTRQYASFSCDKIYAYWYPMKSHNKFRVLLRGESSEYNDNRVVPVSDKAHNGACKAMFFVTCEDDLRYYKLFATKAIQKSKKTH